MYRNNLLLLLLFVSSLGWANSPERTGFGRPFNFPLYLSGNFGELRSNHFHGGLDFKTQHQSGKRLLALADGYISRVQVTQGSGYVLHVVYDNGFTTINRHLQGFVNPLAQWVDSLQYAKESWSIDETLEPNLHRVKQGEHIAWSGNMGYSFAPHLHLDVLETESGDQIDPMPFFTKYLKDSTPPRAQAVMLFPQPNSGVLNGSLNRESMNIPVRTKPKVWGLVGVGIKAYDYMDEVTNFYGVRQMELYVDGELTFKSVVDRFSAQESRYINSWTYKKFMKAFIDPGNKLRMLTAYNDTRGLIRIDEEREYKLEFVLSDYFGNKSNYSLTLDGVKQEIPQIDLSSGYLLKWDAPNFFSRAGLDLSIPEGRLYTHTLLDFQVTPATAESVSPIYQLIDPSDYQPLHQWADLKLRVTKGEGIDENKFYIARVYRNNKFSSMGGRYKDGFIHTQIRDLGTYTVAVDSIPPSIIPIQKDKWGARGEIRFKAEDKETGIKSYKGTIDGQFVPFYLDIMPKVIRYKLDSKRVVKGKKHSLRLEVIDNCGNSTLIEEEFFW